MPREKETMLLTRLQSWNCWLSILILSGVCAGCQFGKSKLGKRDNSMASSLGLASLSHDARPDEDLPSKKVLSENQKLGVKLAMAQSLEKKADVSQAIKLYKDIVRKQPDHAVALHRLAVLHDRQGKPAQAQKYYEQALAIAPNNANIHTDLGYSHYLRKDWSLAEQHLLQAIQIDPQLTRAHNNYGLLLARTGRHDVALTAFSQAGLSEAAARANLMHAMMLANSWDLARSQYNLAVASRSASQDVQTRLAKMSALLDRESVEHGPAQSASESVPVHFEKPNSQPTDSVVRIPAY